MRMRLVIVCLFASFTFPAGAQGLTSGVYNLAPAPATSENLEQMRTAAANTVEVVKTLLYAQSGQSAASAQGRRLWYDPNTLQLTVVDYPANLRLVSDYIRQVQAGQPGARSRSEIIFLKHQEVSTLAGTLDRVTQRPVAVVPAVPVGGRPVSVVKNLRVGQQTTFQGLALRVLRVSGNNPQNDVDDSVELDVRTPTSVQQQTIVEFRSIFLPPYEIYINEVRPSSTPGEGTVRLELIYRP